MYVERPNRHRLGCAPRRMRIGVADRVKKVLDTGARARLEDVREGIIRNSAPFKSA